MLTLTEFESKYKLTSNQIKMACYRGHFDYRVMKAHDTGHGGKRKYIVIYETERTIANVERLLTNGRVATTDENRSKFIILRNGMEVMNNILGATMAGEI